MFRREHKGCAQTFDKEISVDVMKPDAMYGSK
jgi:hypothetical protein